MSNNKFISLKQPEAITSNALTELLIKRGREPLAQVINFKLKRVLCVSAQTLSDNQLLKSIKLPLILTI